MPKKLQIWKIKKNYRSEKIKKLLKLLILACIWDYIFQRSWHHSRVKTDIKWLWYQCWINIYFTRGHVDTYLWWNRSPNCRIFLFACFTNSSRSPLWNTSKSQERLLESLLFSTLQILGNSRWCPSEMTYFERELKTIRMFTYCV